VWTGTHDRIQADLVECDTWQFQAALDRAADADDPAAQVAALEEAVACHRGTLWKAKTRCGSSRHAGTCAAASSTRSYTCPSEPD
jgi:hypothetical protein